MKQIVILGAGPAASFLALSLIRAGHAPLVIGQLRRKPAAEGLSLRVAEALERFGCEDALSLLGPRWHRISAWNGEEVEMNGEFVVERVAFDNALSGDVRKAGITWHEGRIGRVGRDTDGILSVAWTDASGQLRHTHADLIAECRGHSAPRSMQDIHRSGVLMSLGRSFEGARPQPRTTFAESFAHGWAWGAVDTQGRAHIQTVISADMVSRYGGNLEVAHTACLRYLNHLRVRFGGDFRPAGPTRARGIQPALRGGIAQADFLRVGDAAYTCDPLSGHGIFEAASGAIAAVPVIRTLLDRPDDGPLALRYFVERATSVFFSRVKAAHQHYAAETRWPDSEFWRGVHADNVSVVSTQPGPATFTVRPVVEDGFIMDRRIVVSEEYPHGVRFIDGVDLDRLDERLRASPTMELAAFSRALNAPSESILHALQWLQRHRLAPHPVF
jgi:2-polyprenyl-6-methoxyphenol hydroxylase-like FAD-dependent oxidoreductase